MIPSKVCRIRFPHSCMPEICTASQIIAPPSLLPPSTVSEDHDMNIALTLFQLSESTRTQPKTDSPNSESLDAVHILAHDRHQCMTDSMRKIDQAKLILKHQDRLTHLGISDEAGVEETVTALTSRAGKSIKRPWSVEEDIELAKYVKFYGRNWSRIASFMPHRKSFSIQKYIRRKLCAVFTNAAKPFSESLMFYMTRQFKAMQRTLSASCF